MNGSLCSQVGPSWLNFLQAPCPTSPKSLVPSFTPTAPAPAPPPAPLPWLTPDSQLPSQNSGLSPALSAGPHLCAAQQVPGSRTPCSPLEGHPPIFPRPLGMRRNRPPRTLGPSRQSAPVPRAPMPHTPSPGTGPHPWLQGPPRPLQAPQVPQLQPRPPPPPAGLAHSPSHLPDTRVRSVSWVCGSAAPCCLGAFARATPSPEDFPPLASTLRLQHTLLGPSPRLARQTDRQTGSSAPHCCPPAVEFWNLKHSVCAVRAEPGGSPQISQTDEPRLR